jgi:hypothetical protein
MSTHPSPTLRSALPLLLALATACGGGEPSAAGPGSKAVGSDGSAGSGPVTPGGGVSADCSTSSADVGPSLLRRITAAEYQLTVQDLLQLPAAPTLDGMPADTEKDGFKVFTEVQTVSAQHLRGYLAKAQELGAALMADATRRARVLGCEPDAPACLRDFVTRFGRLAYRRALSQIEIDSLVARAETDALDTADRFRFVLEVMLTSPAFLYRAELGDEPEGLAALTATELASKLSFAIWGRAPSAELLDLAEQGKLATDQDVAAAVERLLADPRAEAFYAGFFRQWLGYDILRPPTSEVRGWDDALLPSLQAETDAITQQYAWGGLNFLDALTTNHTYVDAKLATFYGLPAPGPDGSLEIPASHVRANTGLLTHASLLGAKSDGDLIAIRGNWLRQTFLCSKMQVPPSVAEQLGELLVGLTRVQIVKERNMRTECKGCHSVLDPIGVGLAGFDRAGRFDATLDIAEFGIAPALPDAPSPAFDSVAELASKLREMPQVSACLTSRAFLYVNGREPAAADQCTVKAAEQSFSAKTNSFPDLLRGLVQDRSFRLRRSQ